MGAKQTKSSASRLDKKSMDKLLTTVKGEFSEDEIQSWYKSYTESRHSGHRELSKDEFLDVFKELYVGDATEFAEHVFRTFDLNNDGHVDFHEFLLGLCMTGSSDLETKITWAFKVYDIDGDGNISWKEMKDIVQSVCNMASETVIEQLQNDLTSRLRHRQSMDAEQRTFQYPLKNSQRPPMNRYESRDRAAEIADLIFRELDDNGDGLITLEEFKDGAMRLPLVVELLERSPDD